MASAGSRTGAFASATTTRTQSPWLGFGYAMSGILISAFVTYLIGMRMDRGTVRRLAGPKLNRISRPATARDRSPDRIASRAPRAICHRGGRCRGDPRQAARFHACNRARNATWHACSHRLRRSARSRVARPGEENLWLVAAVAMALGIATFLVRRWLLTTQLHGESTRA